MNMFATYHEWRDGVLEELQTSVELLACPKCDGEGEITEDCDCCGQETDSECSFCGGTGQVNGEMCAEGKRKDLTERAYVRAVTDDLKKLAAFTGHDLLSLMGRFIKEYRGESCRGL